MILSVQKEYVEIPTLNGHASSLCRFRGRTYLAWFGGTKEGENDVDIYVTRRDEAGWRAPVRVSAGPLPHWNPVLLPREDHIDLFFKFGTPIPRWQTLRARLSGALEVVGGPEELVPGDVGGRGPVKNKCLKLKSGRWLAPASREFDPQAQWKLETLWRAFVDISDDDGKLWRASPPFPVPVDAPAWGKRPFGVIQPTLWEDEQGVHAMMRATDGWIWRTDSTDNGETWKECRRTSLENINSGIDCVRASDGRLYLAMNGPGVARKGIRDHLEVKVSEDGGETWRTFAVLADDGPKQPDGRSTEFSYPAVIEPRPGVLAITFTWNRRQIRFVEMKLPSP